MYKIRGFTVVLAMLVFVFCGTVQAVEFIQQPPLSKVINVPVGEVRVGVETVMPVITWGADIETSLANGNEVVTAAGSIFAQKNLKLKLVREDDFKKQVEAYMKGDTPYLRGTLGMINMATEVLNRDSRTEPVVFTQLSWSSGGDYLIVKDGINSAYDLKGKTIALQAYGPHVHYLTTILKDAGISDVKIRYTRDITGTENTPGEALKSKDVDAAFVISPDAMKLTSGGKVGTGAEGSVKGAKVFMSTKTADHVIADVYAVRSDYFQSHRKEVEAFFHGKLLAQQYLAELVKNRDTRKPEYKKVFSQAAKLLMDSEQALADTEGMYSECETINFAGNVKFFSDQNWPRNFTKITDEIQTAFVSLGLLSKKVSLKQANWDYNQFKAGLKGTEAVEVPRFNPAAVAQVVEQKRATGTLTTGALFSFEIFFKPNLSGFPAELYAEKFEEAINKAATYSGAVMTIEGHADPSAYLKKKKEGAPESVLVQQKQAAKNLTVQRTMTARDALIQYAKSKGISLDSSQFTVVGHGIGQPKTGMCGQDPCAPKTEQEWFSNMRVVFQLFNVEAEENVFRPLQ